MAPRKKAPRKKPRERISPTEALQIVMTRRAAPAAAKRMQEALHHHDIDIWRDGKRLSPAEVAHLSVLARADDDDPDCWHASIGDDRWDAPTGKYEFSADQIWALVRGKASALSAPVVGLPNPPGKPPAKNWPWLAAVEYGRRLERGEESTAKAMCQWCADTLNVHVDESDMRKLISRATGKKAR